MISPSPPLYRQDKQGESCRYKDRLDPTVMTRTWSDSVVPLLHGSAPPPIDILTVLTDRHCLIVMGEVVTMSGAENEAIVVSEGVHDEEGEREGEREREEAEAVEGEKERQCSGCRTVYTIDQFQGTDKNAGKIMRTCMGCRAKYEKLVVEKICSDCRTQQPLDQFQGSGKRFEGKEMRTCSTCRSRRDYRDVSFMSTRSSEGTKKSLMPEVGYVRDTRRNRLGENRRQMLDKIAKQMVDNGNTFTDKHWKDITESQKLTAWEIPQVKKYIENAMENIEKARKKDKVAAAPPGRKTANSSSSSSSAAEPTPKSSPQPTTSKELTTTRMKPVTRGQTEQVAPRRRLTNNSNQTSIASIAAEFRETPSHQATSASAKGSTSSAPTAKNQVRKNAGVSTPTFIKIDDDTASEAEASDRDVREVQSKAKSPPQTRTQSKHTTPASVTRSSTSKKRSTPPPSSSSIDTEDTYQSKRLRTQQSERESERQREEEEGEEESNPRADLEAFANSLERLSRLLFAARDNLSRKQVGVLENDIHHDWKVDEMSTFVEGFLRGADALDGRIKD